MGTRYGKQVNYIGYRIKRLSKNSTESGIYAFTTVPGLAKWLIKLKLKPHDSITLKGRGITENNFVRWLIACLKPAGFKVKYDKKPGNIFSKLEITKQ